MIQGTKIAGKCRALPLKVTSIAPVVTQSFGKRKAEQLSLTLSMEDTWMDQFDHPLSVKSPQASDTKIVSFNVDDVLMIDDDLNRFASSQLPLLPLTFFNTSKKRFYPTESVCLSPLRPEKHMPFIMFSDELEK